MRMRLCIVAVAAAIALTASGAFAKGRTGSTPTISNGGRAVAEAIEIGIANHSAKPLIPNLPNLGPPLLKPAIDKFNFDDNPIYNGGFLSIPPDPYVAVGPEHVINVGNRYIEWYEKANPAVNQHQGDLGTFFSAAPGWLGTGCFDPKVIYDQYAQRFVVVALERTATASTIVVAISQTSNPNLGWWVSAINAKMTFFNIPLGANCNHWADYPGLAVDDKAVYITNNMFTLGDDGCPFGWYGGGRLWIVDKASYGGPNGSVPGNTTVWDAMSLAGLAGTSQWFTQQPAHMFGPPPPFGSNGWPLGTWLVGYDCFWDGLGNELVPVVEVEDPLGANGGPFFTANFVFSGDIEGGPEAGWPALPDAPQAGLDIGGLDNQLIEVNDRRALNAVWRDNCLYTVAEIEPWLGNPDGGQTTVHWWRIDTSLGTAGMTVADQGNIGAEDLGPETYTFMPQVMVDCGKNMTVGFAASNANIYCGAYYASRNFTDAPGFIGPTCTLRAGLDHYKRFFGGTRNRWGDYSGLALCPVDEATFWIYNEYAGQQGTQTNGSFGLENGRWVTVVGCYRIKEPTVAVAISSFDVNATSSGVSLSSVFISDLDISAVNVYRGLDDNEPQILASQPGGGLEFEYMDTAVEPGRTYSYKIGVVDPDGEFFSQVKRVTVPSPDYALAQNTPNPFNPTTTISFTLAASQRVQLSVFDAQGRLVTTLVNETRAPGAHNIEWNGTDAAGRAVGSGVYFYRLNAGKFSESRKMLLLK